MPSLNPNPRVAIACGGTGGHLFPGLAIGAALIDRGCSVLLLISPKAVDREAVRAAEGMEVMAIEAVGWNSRRPFGFLRGLWRSYRDVTAEFEQRPPSAVLGMGGFTSVAPILSARRFGARAFLHESNAVPGRANRWLASRVELVFLGFGSAREHFVAARVQISGTPVREGLRRGHPGEARRALGLDPLRPVLVVMGGSQGASAINTSMIEALPELNRRCPALQYVHLTGKGGAVWVRAAYHREGCRAVIEPFVLGMDKVLRAATLVVSRSGASSLAEFAAVRLPSLLIPYPTAADDHQSHNARAFADGGSARWFSQAEASPHRLSQEIVALIQSESDRQVMADALSRRDCPSAAGQIADAILVRIGSVSAAGEPQRRSEARAEDPVDCGEPQSWKAQISEWVDLREARPAGRGGKMQGQWG